MLKTFKEKFAEYKTRIALAATSVLGIVGTASAISFTSIELVIDDIAALMTPILAMIVSIVPILITLALLGFLLGVFLAITGRIKV